MLQIAPKTVSDLAAALGGQVRGRDDVVISSIAALSVASTGSISFYGSDNFRTQFLATQASCLLVRDADADAAPCASVIVVENPYQSCISLAQHCYVPSKLSPGYRSSSASIDPTAIIHESAAIGPGCVVGRECSIGENVELVANVVLYPRTTIAGGTTVHANVTIYQDTVIGEHCIIHAGSVVGADGFGYVELSDKSYQKIPQVGNVVLGSYVEIGANVTIDRAALESTVIEDGVKIDNLVLGSYVEIGANVTIDRAALESTVIEDGVKIDNLVQIAHGVRVGENTGIAAQVGIAGSTVIGKRNRLAGQVGIAGHTTTTDDVVVMGQTGVTKSIEVPGVYSGNPAQPHMIQLRQDVALKDIVSIQQKLNELSLAIKALESKD